MTDDERIVLYLETGDDALLAEMTREEADDLRATRTLLEDEALWGEPDPDLASRIDAEVRTTVQATVPPLPTPTSAPVPMQTSATSTGASTAAVVDMAAARERRGLHRGLVAVVGLAAGVVLAIGAVALQSASDDEGDQVAVSATDLGGDITGTASSVARPAGVEIVLDIEGLPRAAVGSFYQGWVKGEKGLVTIGTFHTGGRVVLWSGVELADYPLLTVTLEPEDGDPASSGQVLLTAPIGG
jgi:hypothetical protein